MPDNPNLMDEKNIPSSWEPLEVPAVVPGKMMMASAPAPLPHDMPQYFSGSMPPALQHDTSFVSTEVNSPRIPKNSLMPLGNQASPFSNAAAQSTSIVVTSQAIAAIPATPAVAQVTDGLTHGDPIWEHDSAFVELRDDFVPYFDSIANGTTLFQIGELSWQIFNPGSTGMVQQRPHGGNPPYIGQFAWENTSTASGYGALSLEQFSGLATYQQQSWALLENPGWKATWIWKHDGSTTGSGNAFSTVKKSLYIGLSGAPLAAISGAGSTASPRPDVFIGLRYDTSTVPAGMAVTSVAAGTGVYTGIFANGGGNAYAGQNIIFKGFAQAANNGTFACTASTATTLTVTNAGSVVDTTGVAVLVSLPLTAAATAVGNTTVYTMVDVNARGEGASGGFIGISFVVTGFVNAANNGTFTCVASNNTTLTLSNSQGVAETHAGFATGGSINDSFYTFEVVENRSYSTATRRNVQGTVFVTNVAPAQNVWHRLDIVCSAAGVVVLTLDGSAINTFTFTVPKMTTTLGPTGQVSCVSSVGRISVTAAAGTAGGTNTQFPFGAGSTITISGLTGGNAALNGIWTGASSSDGITCYFPTTAGPIGNNSTDATLVAYPALTPVFSFGNDTSSAPVANQMRTFIDFFSIVWNPNLGPSAPGTPDKTKARYW